MKRKSTKMTKNGFFSMFRCPCEDETETLKIPLHFLDNNMPFPKNKSQRAKLYTLDLSTIPKTTKMNKIDISLCSLEKNCTCEYKTKT